MTLTLEFLISVLVYILAFVKILSFTFPDEGC